MDARLDWLELVTGFACNCRCQLCSSGLQGPEAHLSEEELAAWLARGRARGAKGVWFGGGEPTLRPELPAACARARALGYARIRLQTNGLRLAYPAYLARLISSGLGEVSVSVKGWDESSHDAFTRRPGAWGLMMAALGRLAGTPVAREADVLLTSPLLPHLTGLLGRLVERGVGRVTLWLASLHGLPPGAARADLVPALGGLRGALREAFARARALGLEVTSLHTPPCALAPEDRDHYLHAGRYRLLVAVPGGRSFMAEESPMEGGAFPQELCGRCAARPACLGMRVEQLERFGRQGLEPLSA